jgi:integrase
VEVRTTNELRNFWQATLKRLGVRYRRPYNLRHTYATLGLMNGLKPAFMARQLGDSLEMSYKAYAKWIAMASTTNASWPRSRLRQTPFDQFSK